MGRDEGIGYRVGGSVKLLGSHFGALGGNGAHGALWGYSAAIPSGKPLRVDGDSEWKAIPSGWLFR